MDVSIIDEPLIVKFCLKIRHAEIYGGKKFDVTSTFTPVTTTPATFTLEEVKLSANDLLAYLARGGAFSVLGRLFEKSSCSVQIDCNTGELLLVRSLGGYNHKDNVTAVEQIGPDWMRSKRVVHSEKSAGAKQGSKPRAKPEDDEDEED